MLLYTVGYGALPATQMHERMKHQKRKQLRHFFAKGSGYEQRQEWQYLMPWPLLALCRMTEVPPKRLISQLLSDLAQDSWNRHPNEGVRSLLVEYFILRGYGADRYSEEDIRSMFAEMNALGMLWPDEGNSRLIDSHVKWRKRQQAYWFEKWYYKIRRKEPA